jgi:hypothetical protein
MNHRNQRRPLAQSRTVVECYTDREPTINSSRPLRNNRDQIATPAAPRRRRLATITNAPADNGRKVPCSSIPSSPKEEGSRKLPAVLFRQQELTNDQEDAFDALIQGKLPITPISQEFHA